MFTNAPGMEEEPLKLLSQERGIGNVVYNNVNGNASVLCPYFVCMCAASELWTWISQWFHNLQNVIHTEMTISEMFSLPLGVFKLSPSLKNYTVNMASLVLLSLSFSARRSFGRFPSERTLHSNLKVMEPARVLSESQYDPWCCFCANVSRCFHCYFVVIISFKSWEKFDVHSG